MCRVEGREVRERLEKDEVERIQESSIVCCFVGALVRGGGAQKAKISRRRFF